MTEGPLLERRWFGLMNQVSQTLMRFDTIDATLPAMLDVFGGFIPVRTAVLIAQVEDGPTVYSWRSEDATVDELERAEAAARDSFRLWLGVPGSPELRDIDRRSDPAARLLRPSAGFERGGGSAGRYIVLPLAIADKPVFGALQIEPDQAVDERHLAFFSTTVNQLAIALDRDRANRYEQFALAEARQAILSRDQFLGVVSHDLRNMAAATQLAAALARRQSNKDDAPLQLRLSTIEHSTQQMSKLLDDLLDTAAVEAGALNVVLRPTDVIPVLRNAANVFGAMGESRGVRLVLETPAVLPRVPADPLRLEQVLGNLLRNAFSFSPAGGTVFLRATEDAGQVRISVVDQGPGIPKEEQPLIFGRFYQNRDAGTKGTGLGLFIATRLVEKHGGQIGVESEPGAGATIWFTVPLRPR